MCQKTLRGRNIRDVVFVAMVGLEAESLGLKTDENAALIDRLTSWLCNTWVNIK